MALPVSVLAMAHSDVSRQVIGAFYDVYRELGYGFDASVYQAAMKIVLQQREIRFALDPRANVRFRDVVVGEFHADFIVEDCIVVDTTASDKISSEHELQVLSFLRASGLSVGLVLNFGPRPTVRRLYYSGERVRADDAQDSVGAVAPQVH
ncbi:MAG: GxxExxY protein [Gemmatimonadaceae bacterium]|nr:GxxExxY protein [Gemmatimonadaceae bacterium]